VKKVNLFGETTRKIRAGVGFEAKLIGMALMMNMFYPNSSNQGLIFD
jgi:hypothetical protein